MQLGDSFKRSTHLESPISILSLQTQTIVFTGDQGEQELYSFTIPPNFFTQSGNSIDAKIRVKYVAGGNGLTGMITVKMDGTTIFSNQFAPFNSVDDTGYAGQTFSLLEMVELNGATSIANIGNLGYIEYDNIIEHTITVTYSDLGNHSDNSFSGAYFKLISSK